MIGTRNDPHNCSHCVDARSDVVTTKEVCASSSKLPPEALPDMETYPQHRASRKSDIKLDTVWRTVAGRLSLGSRCEEFHLNSGNNL
jgi:hypothetical protein